MTTTDTDLNSIERWFGNLPLLDEDEGPRPSKSRSGESAGTTRRRFVQAAAVIGGGLSLGVLGAIAEGFRRPASAAVGTTLYSCGGYDGFSGYSPGTPSKACVGASASYRYCGPDGWFMEGHHDGWEYYDEVRCGEGLYKHMKKNAWQWPHNGNYFRCADGFRIKDNSGGYKDDLICAQWIGYA